MNPHVNAIAGRLSLRPPQRQALEILDRLVEVVPPRKDTDREAALAVRVLAVSYTHLTLPTN